MRERESRVERKEASREREEKRYLLDCVGFTIVNDQNRQKIEFGGRI